MTFTSCPSRASRRSESGKELRKNMKADLLWCLQLIAFQAKKEATKADSKRKERKKAALWTTRRMKMETKRPMKKRGKRV